MTKQRYNVIAMSLSDVALKLPYSCSGNVRRRCKNDVVATSHYDVFLQRLVTFPSQLYGNVRVTLDSDAATT